jgi:hypothetical protein
VQYVAVRVLPGRTVEFAFPSTIFAVKRVHIRSDHTYKLDVLMDPVPASPNEGTVGVLLDGKPAWSVTVPNPIIRDRLQPLVDVTLGEANVPGLATRFSGTLERLPGDTALCRQLAPHIR